MSNLMIKEFNGFDKSIKLIDKLYDNLLEENRKLKDTIQKLEADKLNDERVRELTEQINWMKGNGFFLTKEDVKKVQEAKSEFRKNNSCPNFFNISWEYGLCHLGEVAVCYAEYTDKDGIGHKDEICTICH